MLLGQEHDALTFRELIRSEWQEMLEREGLPASAAPALAGDDEPPCPACGCSEPLTAEGECPDCGLCLG